MFFLHNNGSIHYKFITLGYHTAYFVNSEQKGITCYTEEQVINMLEFLIDNIFVEFEGRLFQQIVGIPMRTNYAPLLADLFLFSYESEFLETLVKNKKIKEARSFNFTFRYIDNVLSINNPNFSDWVPLIYSPELEQQTRFPPPHVKTYTSNLTYTVISVPESMTNETIFIVKLSISSTLVAIS